jgi:hypothetical protein
MDAGKWRYPGSKGARFGWVDTISRKARPIRNECNELETQRVVICFIDCLSIDISSFICTVGRWLRSSKPPS